MSITPILIDGFEHGVATPVVSGGGLCDNVTGNPVVQSVTKRTGTYALKCAPAAGYSYIKYTLASPTTIVARFYLYITSMTASTAITIAYPTTTVGDARIRLDYTGGVYKVKVYDGTTSTDVATVSAGAWIQIDAKWTCGANPHTLAVSVDGGTEVTISPAWAISAYTSWFFGVASTATCEIYLEDLVLSATAADYPIGAGGVIGLSPSSDGTHTNTAAKIQTAAGVDIVASTTDAYTSVNSVPMGDITKYIKQIAAGAYYAELKFSTAQAGIQGVAALLAYQAATATTDKMASYIIDEDAVLTTVWGNPTTTADFSETTVFYKKAILPVTAGGWDTAAIGALKWRNGNSDDINPVPYAVDLLLQVAYSTATTAYGLRAGTGSFVLSGQNAYLLKNLQLRTTTGSFTLSGQNALLLKGYPLRAGTGSFALSGQSIRFLWNHQLRTITGGFTESGQNAYLLYNRKLWATTGSFSLSGQVATMLRGYSVWAGTGGFTESGKNARLLWHHKLYSTAGSFTESGQSVYLLYNRKLFTTTGSFTLTGLMAILTYSGGGVVYNLFAGLGSFSLTGQNARLLAHHKLFTTAGSITLAGTSLVMYNRLLRSAQGTFTLSGQNAQLLRGYALRASPGAFLLTGNDAQMTIEVLGQYILKTGVGLFVLTGMDATLFIPTPSWRTEYVTYESRKVVIMRESRTMEVDDA